MDNSITAARLSCRSLDSPASNTGFAMSSAHLLPATAFDAIDSIYLPSADEMQANFTKAYFPVSGFDHKPDELILIGSIILDSMTPDEPISDEPLKPLPKVYDAYKDDWMKERNKTVSGSIGIWAQFLSHVFGVGGDIAGNFEKEDEDIFKFEKLETFFIKPTKDYINESMRAPAVTKFLQENPKTKSAFMITGVKIARGASAMAKKIRDVGGDATIAASATPFTGVPVSGGPKTSFKNRIVNKQGFTGSSDFVYAYRLRRISIQPKTGKVLDKGNYTKNATLYHENIASGQGDSHKDSKGAQSGLAEKDGPAQEFVFSTGDEDFGVGSLPSAFECITLEDSDGEGGKCRAILSTRT